MLFFYWISQIVDPKNKNISDIPGLAPPANRRLLWVQNRSWLFLKKENLLHCMYFIIFVLLLHEFIISSSIVMIGLRNAFDISQASFCEKFLLWKIDVYRLCGIYVYKIAIQAKSVTREWRSVIGLKRSMQAIWSTIRELLIDCFSDQGSPINCSRRLTIWLAIREPIISFFFIKKIYFWLSVDWLIIPLGLIDQTLRSTKFNQDHVDSIGSPFPIGLAVDHEIFPLHFIIFIIFILDYPPSQFSWKAFYYIFQTKFFIEPLY